MTRLKQIAALAREGLAQWDAPVATLAQRPFNRIIYLGSGPLEALARECALKVLEPSRDKGTFDPCPGTARMVAPASSRKCSLCSGTMR